MSHRSKFKHIPHTIIRGGFYYFNIRNQNSLIRISLKTNCFEVAFNAVSSIITCSGGIKNLRLMDKDTIFKAIERIRNKITDNTIALLELDSQEAAISLSDYEEYFASRYAEHENYSNIDGAIANQYNIAPPPKIKGLRDFKLDQLHDNQKSVDVLACKKAEQLLLIHQTMEEENTNALDSIASVMVYEDTKERLVSLYKQSQAIRECIESGEYVRARELIGLHNEAVPLEAKKDPQLKDFVGYADEYLRKGKDGNLKGINNQKVRPAWDIKILKANTDMFGFFKLIFEGYKLDEITTLVIDEKIRSIIEKLPKRNLTPFNKMSKEEIVELILSGTIIEEKKIIADKTKDDYEKLLAGFFSQMVYEGKLEESPIKKLTVRKTKKQVRGAFTATQVTKILKWAKKQTRTEKKWPIFLMAFAGLRNEEAMQLRKLDIKRDEDSKIWFIAVREEAGSIKTPESERNIPIHSSLIELGFLDYVQTCEEVLFSKNGRFLTTLYSDVIKKSWRYQWLMAMSRRFPYIVCVTLLLHF